jgi:hypothetical protein
MSEQSNIPTPQPEVKIPRDRLWFLLVTPPVATAILNLIVGAVYGNGAGELILVAVPWVVLFLIIGCLVGFIELVGRRYRGRSLVFLSAFYFIGQIVVSLASWFGSCVLAMR